MSETTWVALEQGACPMCALEFDDPVEFRQHLGHAHDLYDDEGKATGFGELAVVDPTAPVLGPIIPEPERPEVASEPPAPDRPIGLLALVLLLLCVLGAMIAFVGRGGDDEVTANAGVESTPRRSAPAPDGAAAETNGTTTPTHSTATPVTAAPEGVAASSAGRSSTGSPQAAGSGSPTPTSSTTTTAPAQPTTTGPPSDFTAPLATGAAVDSCVRDQSTWHVTFSWEFVGGTGWEPDPADSPLGGNRYQRVVTTPRAKGVAITTVTVIDTTGQPQPVSLQPPLSTASC